MASRPGFGAALAEALSELEDSLRSLDALYIPTRYPDSLPMVSHEGSLRQASTR
ncbi:MAG: hypothetical protein VKO39_01450 [Cyanobacteriota bacterium]|nr:hypothetical protein [Cyanobacteriota bacterium]